MGHGKSRRFVIFLVTFLTFWTEKSPIRIYRKTAPTKSTVLGPRPPPWRKDDFYRILSIFDHFGAFNRAGKTVTKIGIYSKPPPKSEIYAVLIIRDPIYQHFNSSLTITELFALRFWSLVLYFPLPFIGIKSNWLLWVFLVGCRVLFCFLLVLVDLSVEHDSFQTQTKAPQTRDFTGAGNNSRPNLSRYTIIWSLLIGSGANIGPRYSLSTLTIGNTYVCI
jgi:hypothetical protein